jgi:hypothetical protein
MWQLNDIVALAYRYGYVYRIAFDDGLEGDVDFTEYLGVGPIFEPLRDLEFFRQARIEGGTICWPNGADVAPETLYSRIESARQQPVLAS